MAKVLITEDWCWQVYADTEAKTMEAQWLQQASLEGEDFKAYLRKWAELVEEHKPNGFLVDSRLGHVVMTPEIQAWHDQEMVKRYVLAGVQKIAFILPNNIFQAASIERAFSEDLAANTLDTRYFEDIEAARAWLVKRYW